MDRFAHRENVAHYRRLLAEPDVANDRVRKALVRLLAEEQTKEATPMNHDNRARLRIAPSRRSDNEFRFLRIADLTSRQAR